jgi:hypothetical protein
VNQLHGPCGSVTGTDEKALRGPSFHSLNLDNGSPGWNLFLPTEFRGLSVWQGSSVRKWDWVRLVSPGCTERHGWWEVDGGARRDIAGEGKSARITRFGGRIDCWEMTYAMRLRDSRGIGIWVVRRHIGQAFLISGWHAGCAGFSDFGERVLIILEIEFQDSCDGNRAMREKRIWDWRPKN